MVPPAGDRSWSGAPLGRIAALVAAALALACAGPRPRAGAGSAPASEPDCEALRDNTVRSCEAGFELRRGDPSEREDLEQAVAVVCPYAGAVAWSGCHRGALRRFAPRTTACGDRAAYVESSIQTSCMRPIDVPLARWNEIVRRCFEWAEAGAERYASSCRAAGAKELDRKAPGSGKTTPVGSP